MGPSQQVMQLRKVEVENFVASPCQHHRMVLLEIVSIYLQINKINKYLLKLDGSICTSFVNDGENDCHQNDHVLHFCAAVIH
jgi:hypothetical protein